MQRWESFHFNGRHCGALFRDVTPERLLTRVAFPLDEDEAYLVESRIERAGPLWQSMTYWQQPGDVAVAAQRGSHSETSMPGYGEFLLLDSMLAAGQDRLDFAAIIDSAPDAPSAPARIELVGPDFVQFADGSACDGQRIDVTIASTVTSSHWLVKNEIVASDWKGARSQLRPSAEEALQGIDGRIVHFLRQGPDANHTPSSENAE